MNCKKSDFLLYAVTDNKCLNGRKLSDCVFLALQGGATFVQLRDKLVDDKALIAEATEIKSICKEFNVPFLINDNVKVAKAVDADGVHLGQGDMQLTEARKILGNNKIIGVSAHNLQEALIAEKNGADYLGVGAAFQTGTKSDAKAISHSTINEICENVSIPVVAIGGIGINNISLLKGLGLSGVAVVGAVFAQEDIKSSTALLKQEVLKNIIY